MSSLFDPGSNECPLGCGKPAMDRVDAEDGAGDGRPVCGMKPPGSCGTDWPSIMDVRAVT